MNGIYVAFTGAVICLLLIGGLLANAFGYQRRLKARVEKIGERTRPMTVEERSRRQIKRTAAGGSPFLEGLANRLLPRPGEITVRLERTGRRISLGKCLVVSFGVAAVTAVAVSITMQLPWFVALALAISTGTGIPHLVVGRMIAKRRARFAALFPDAIDLMVRGLRSGLPVTETVAAAGREMAEPVGSEFQRIADSIRLGQTLEDALWEAAKRLNTPEFKFFVISLSVQKETGGNLAETLANLSEILRSRKQMRLKIRAMSSEARASAIILGALPFFMFVLIYVLSPEYEEILITDMRGRIMLGMVAALMAVGGFVMHKMVRFEV